MVGILQGHTTAAGATVPGPQILAGNKSVVQMYTDTTCTTLPIPGPNVPYLQRNKIVYLTKSKREARLDLGNLSGYQKIII